VGTSIVYVTATDADSGINAKIFYSIDSGPNSYYFSITSSGLVYLRNSLSAFGNYTTLDISVESKDYCNHKYYVPVYILVTPGIQII